MPIISNKTPSKKPEELLSKFFNLLKHPVTQSGNHAGSAKYSGLNKGPGSQWSQPVNKSCNYSHNRLVIFLLFWKNNSSI